MSLLLSLILIHYFYLASADVSGELYGKVLFLAFSPTLSRHPVFVSVSYLTTHLWCLPSDHGPGGPAEGGIFIKGAPLSWHLGGPWRSKVLSEEGQGLLVFQVADKDSYCKHLLLLSGFLRMGEGCFRLHHTCLENARIIVTMEARGTGEIVIRFGNRSSRQWESPRDMKRAARSPAASLG